MLDFLGCLLLQLSIVADPIQQLQKKMLDFLGCLLLLDFLGCLLLTLSIVADSHFITYEPTVGC